MSLAEPLSRRAQATHAWLGRARRSGSHEQNLILGIVKSALAATLSWYVAHDVLAAEAPAFAPFTAVLMMQVTVYRSAVQSLRYIGAVLLGIAVQAFLAFAAGPDVLTFALVSLITLVIARWRFLGEQGAQVPTAAFFAFSVFLTSSGFDGRLMALGEIVLLVAIGCAVGTIINLVFFPPMRHRSVEWAIGALSHSMCDLLGDVSRQMAAGDLDESSTEAWRRRADALDSEVEQARASIRTAWESLLFNPSRLLTKHRPHTTFEGYEQLVEALGRVASQVGSMARALHLWADDDRRAPHQEFLARYGELMDSLGEITRTLSQLDEDHLSDQAVRLCRSAEGARECTEALTRIPSQDDPPPFDDLTQPYGVLLIEAQRLMDEMQYSCDIVKYYVDERDRR
ncbi:aromatic acid exporter family protein [Nocardiopsis sp. MG754419]|uniref:FUSC family protein n=1 Tax=Nocardiopsis sp. MG754419 TaxID=2259865 RepID=UPI001BACC13B|nr:aromatic acid exporter family protein [Nocardiopsis sp. MG754419]MBR8743961.1 hypothetical protein [Nocardiopsis sp. MG754419]